MNFADSHKNVNPDSGLPLDEFYFQWHITERCNLRCKHCYQEEGAQSEFSLKRLREVADQIDSTLERWDMRGRIALTGGEPFLKEELFPLMAYLGQKRNIHKITILTNGTLLTGQTTDRLKTVSNLHSIQISLDGASEETHDYIRGKGSYRKAIHGLRLLRERLIETRLMFTAHRKNLHEVPSLIDLAIEEDVDTLVIERMVPAGQSSNVTDWLLTREEIQKLYELIARRSDAEYEKGTALTIWKRRSLWVNIDPERAMAADVPTQIALGNMCSIGVNSLTILGDGTILPCRRLPIPIGNLKSDSIYDIWHKSELLWKIRDKNGLKGKCHGCKLISRCSGCRAIAYAVTGDYMAEDPQCWR
jgi:AdoMet-dependent heme synthase